jgi:hypothetical protein
MNGSDWYALPTGILCIGIFFLIALILIGAL